MGRSNGNSPGGEAVSSTVYMVYGSGDSQDPMNSQHPISPVYQLSVGQPHTRIHSNGYPVPITGGAAGRTSPAPDLPHHPPPPSKHKKGLIASSDSSKITKPRGNNRTVKAAGPGKPGGRRPSKAAERIQIDLGVLEEQRQQVESDRQSRVGGGRGNLRS